jgi:pimeloyl-ACP methyl ester carboxylesterase
MSRGIMQIILFVVLAVLIGAGLWLYTPDRPLAELERRYLNSPADYVDVAGLRLHVRDSGPKDGPAVIFLHGFGSSLHTWEAWAAALGQDKRVIRLDLPGFGLTGADPAGDYTDARSIEVLVALMDKLGIERAAVVGNSMGGRIAWTFAARHPERVSKLVLISPDGFESAGLEYGKKPSVPSLLKLMQYALPKSMLRSNLRPAYADPRAMTDALVDRYYDMMLAPGVRGAIIARMQQTVLEKPEPLLARIQTPTLLLWGEQDRLIPIANAEDYLKAIPNVRLVRLPAVGHLPQEEAPEASLAPLKAFLDGKT